MADVINVGDLNQQNLNIIRHYRFDFFTIIGTGPWTIQPIPNTSIQDSLNFSFNYTIGNGFRNTINFKFYNLSQSTIGLFTSKTKNVGFRFSAWYNNDNKGDIAIFSGSTSVANTYQEGADTITEITATDYFTSLYYPLGFNLTIPAGTTFYQIIKMVLLNYGGGLSLDEGSADFLQGTYKTRKVFTGSRNQLIQQVAQDAGLTHTIQQNILLMYPLVFRINSANIFQKIDKTNGLVGYPRAVSLAAFTATPSYFSGIDLNQNLSIIEVTTLLRNYKITGTVELKSQFYTGRYEIRGITHHGEWRGNAWYSTLSLIQ